MGKRLRCWERRRAALLQLSQLSVFCFLFAHPDASYEKLKCGFTPVERTDSQFQMVQDYVKNTHGHTHTQYSLEVLDLFDLDRQGEAEKFSSAGFDKDKNVQLLWHGSVSSGEARRG